MNVIHSSYDISESMGCCVDTAAADVAFTAIKRDAIKSAISNRFIRDPFRF